MHTDVPDGLLAALLMDGRGGAVSLDWPGVRNWTGEKGHLWVHLDRVGAASGAWVRREAGLSPEVADALLEEETRPRWEAIGDGLLVNLRGVNLNPGADPEDMVSLRAWVQKDRVITVRHRRLLAAQDLRDDLGAGRGPVGAPELLVSLASRLTERMEPVIADLSDRVDHLEEILVTSPAKTLRRDLAQVRRECIMLRRYLAPQREALFRAPSTPPEWLKRAHLGRLRDAADRVTRYVEDLDAARERAAIAQEELASRIAEHMNRTMYLLSLVAAIFLPLGLITGLLGINVGGIPGSDNPWAFIIVCGMLGALAVALVVVFRRARWL